jgi:hypothetical protein
MLKMPCDDGTRHKRMLTTAKGRYTAGVRPLRFAFTVIIHCGHSVTSKFHNVASLSSLFVPVVIAGVADASGLQTAM